MKSLSQIICEKLKITADSEIKVGGSNKFLTIEEISEKIEELNKKKPIRFILFERYVGYPTRDNGGWGDVPKYSKHCWNIQFRCRTPYKLNINDIFCGLNDRLESDKINNIYCIGTGKLPYYNCDARDVGDSRIKQEKIGAYNIDNKKFKIYNIEEDQQYINILLAQTEKDLDNL